MTLKFLKYTECPSGRKCRNLCKDRRQGLLSIIEKGEADIIMAFEMLEALRWAEYLKEDGKLLVNEQKINPMPVIIGKEKYPENIMQMLKENYKNVISLDALKIARECKNIKAVNTV